MTRTKLVDPRTHFSRTRAQINRSEADSNIIAGLNQTKSEIHNCPASYDTMNNSDYLMTLFFPKTQIITIPKWTLLGNNWVRNNWVLGPIVLILKHTQSKTRITWDKKQAKPNKTQHLRQPKPNWSGTPNDPKQSCLESDQMAQYQEWSEPETKEHKTEFTCLVLPLKYIFFWREMQRSSLQISYMWHYKCRKLQSFWKSSKEI